MHELFLHKIGPDLNALFALFFLIFIMCDNLWHLKSVHSLCVNHIDTIFYFKY